MTEPIVGFWHALWRHRRAVFLSWDVWSAVVLGALGATIVPEPLLLRAATQVASIGLTIMGAILGVILAGLAIVVVFLDREYLKVLERAGGVHADFFPFWFTAALAVVTVVLDVALVLIAEALPHAALRIAVGVVLWFALWTLFATLNLVAFVGAHGENRALQILKSEQDDSTAGPSERSSNTTSQRYENKVRR